MRRASSAHDAPNRLRVARLVSTHEENVAVAFRQPAEREDFIRGRVPGQDVPAAAGDIGRQIEALDGAPDRGGYGFAGRRRGGRHCCVSARRCSCSALPSRSARASASIVVADGLTVRPCSSRMYQSTPMPASSATSSRRRPGVRRRRPTGRPTAFGVSFSRRERRKSPSSLCLGSARAGTSSSRDSINPRIIPGLVGRNEGLRKWASRCERMPHESRRLEDNSDRRSRSKPLPDPSLGTGEVIVDVMASRVLAYANEVLSGERKYLLELPVVPGPGAIGRVRATGPDATHLAEGDWVYCDPTVRSRDDALSPDITLQGLTRRQRRRSAAAAIFSRRGMGRADAGADGKRHPDRHASPKRTPRGGARWARCWCRMAASSPPNCRPEKPCWSTAPPEALAARRWPSRWAWVRPASSRPAATRRRWPIWCAGSAPASVSSAMRGDEDDDRKRILQAAPGADRLRARHPAARGQRDPGARPPS